MQVMLIAMPKRPYALMVAMQRELSEIPDVGTDIVIRELGHVVRVHAVKPDNRVEFIVEASEVAFLRQKGWQNYDRLN